MNSVRTIKLFQPTELNLVNNNTVGARNTAANIDNNNEKLLTGYSRLESISILPSNFKIIASHVYKNYELKILMLNPTL